MAVEAIYRTSLGLVGQKSEVVAGSRLRLVVASVVFVLMQIIGLLLRTVSPWDATKVFVCVGKQGLT